MGGTWLLVCLGIVVVEMVVVVSLKWNDRLLSVYFRDTKLSKIDLI